MKKMTMGEMTQWLLDQSFYIFGDNGLYDYKYIVSVAKNKGWKYNSREMNFTKEGNQK